MTRKFRRRTSSSTSINFDNLDLVFFLFVVFIDKEEEVE